MEPIVFVLVAGAAVLHVAWNVLLKTAGDPLRAATVGMSTAALVICPAAIVGWLLIGRPAVPPEAIALGVASGALEAAYFVFLAAAYRRGDLSVVYPIARGTAPLLAVAVGVVILGERLGPEGFLGVAFLLVGLLMLQRPWRFFRRSAGGDGFDPAVGFALLTGVTIAAYSAVDSVGTRARRTVDLRRAALGLAAWCSCGPTCWSPGPRAAGGARRRRGRDRAPTRTPGSTIGAPPSAG